MELYDAIQADWWREIKLAHVTEGQLKVIDLSVRTAVIQRDQLLDRVTVNWITTPDRLAIRIGINTLPLLRIWLLKASTAKIGSWKYYWSTYGNETAPRMFWFDGPEISSVPRNLAQRLRKTFLSVLLTKTESLFRWHSSEKCEETAHIRIIRLCGSLYYTGTGTPSAQLTPYLSFSTIFSLSFSRLLILLPLSTHYLKFYLSFYYFYLSPLYLPFFSPSLRLFLDVELFFDDETITLVLRSPDSLPYNTPSVSQQVRTHGSSAPEKKTNN